MENTIKKLLYTSVGLVANAAEKFQLFIEDVSSEESETEKKGKQILDDLFETAEAKKEEFESAIKTKKDEILDKMPEGTKSDVNELLDRIASLEKKLENFFSQKAPQADAEAPQEAPKADTEEEAPKKPAAKKKAAPKKSTGSKKTTARKKTPPKAKSEDKEEDKGE